jgi:hypothetical protein
MRNHIIYIPNTLAVVSDAIQKAEGGLKKHIKAYYHNANEEFITGLFYGQIKYQLRKASMSNKIGEAFIEDLRHAASEISYNHFSIDHEMLTYAEGLIADIYLHNKRQEGRTGGDFGLIVARPQLNMDDDSIVLKKGSSSGLLCQAKLKKIDGSWEPLRRSQEKALSLYNKFFSLALYSYKNDNRDVLNKIHWKNCKGIKKSKIVNSLKINDFNELMDVKEVITSLGQNKIGTTDEKDIKDVISLGKQTTFEIKVFNPKDGDPKKDIIQKVIIKQPVKALTKVYVRRT